jgi:quinol monooxygenase YgiN
MTVSEYEDLCNQIVGALAQIPGLLSKVWLADRNTNTFGAIHTWRDDQALRAHEATELCQNVVRNPHFAKHHGTQV